MTRKNETIRTEYKDKQEVIYFKSYCVLMTVLEEVFSGLKDIHAHPLFHHRPNARKNTSLMKLIRMQQPENFQSVIIYHDPNKKYENEIEIPSTKSKTRKFKCISIMNREHKRGIGETDVEHNIHTFEHTANRGQDLLTRLFS